MRRANSALTARARRITLFAVAIFALASSALANGPRWVTGPPYFSNAGNAVLWYNNPNLLYFTDSGDLSAYVPHAAADAIVAAAAGVWNVPTSYLTIAQGGTLAEHVSSANSYITSSGPVFPADVEPTNFASIPIAIVYDSDGSITDMLLGSGASAPAECRQNAVTEDVDYITTGGAIQHAVLVLNGRCTGPAPQQQLQLQYQLQRAFGRVLGLAWSQTNDNVFTRSPQPTTIQAQHWPIMHPIDIVCGAYTYQCLPNPFTLRDDDIASISGLYPMFAYWPFPTPTPAPGKQWSYAQAGKIIGHLTFPTGQGMQGVNITLNRWRGGTSGPEPYEDVSAVTGYSFRRDNGNPVIGSSSSLNASMGNADPSIEGYYQMSWVPDDDPLGSSNGPMLGVLGTESINPLYTGAYSLGPYTDGVVTPSGPSQTVTSPYPVWPYFYSGNLTYLDLPPANGASNCNTSADGIETAPAAIDPSGWWTGVLCSYGHAAWSSFSMQAGRTATIEVTALDESSLATTAKAMPLIGVWAASDPTGTLPTVAATPAAFNTLAIGTTATQIVTNSSAQPLRFVLADARGDGRPDFAYRARVLYADSVAPSTVGASGGLITITGTGFRPGNSVTINGIPAVVASWTSTSIIAVAPPVIVLPSTPVDITISDLTTGGSTTMSAALTYSSSVASDIMSLIAAPSGALAVGTPATFAVRIFQPDGVTPIPNLPVAFTFTGPAQIGSQTAGCLGSPCSITTDSAGLASATINTSAFGAVTLQAYALGLTQTASFTAIARSVSALQPTEYIAGSSTVTWSPQLAAIQNSTPSPASKLTGPVHPASLSHPPPPQPTPRASRSPPPRSARSPPEPNPPHRPAPGTTSLPLPHPASAPPLPPSASISPRSASSSSAAPTRRSPRPPFLRPSSLKSPTPPAIPSPAPPSISTRPWTPWRPRSTRPAPHTAPAPSRPRSPHPPPPQPPISTVS